MLVLLDKMIERQIVYPENMKRNMELTKGLYGSQSILLALTDKGAARRDAYEAVQSAAMDCWRTQEPFIGHVKKSATIAKYLSPKEIEIACSPAKHFRHVKSTFKKLGITK